MSGDLEDKIHAHLASGDISAAAALAEQLLAGNLQSPLILNLCAWRREQKGELADARRLLRHALELNPGDPLVTAALAGVARQQGDLREAVSLADRAIARDRGCATAWLERGHALDASGSIAAARDSFGEAVRVDPTLGPAWAALAYAAARLGDLGRARAAATTALRLRPAEPLAVLAQARCDLDERCYAEAETRLSGLLHEDIASDNRILAYALLGQAQAALGEHDRAYQAFAAANETFLRRHGSGPPVPQADFTDRIAREFGTAAPRDWPRLEVPPVPGAAAKHIFVLGFPRSGTTLTENILASLEGAHALEEHPTFEQADATFLAPAGGMGALAQLEAGHAQAFRRAYWESAFVAGVPKGAPIFVDMDPLKSLRLPLIARLFPDAHIVFVRRDPRDVVWSCFRTSFAPSSAAFEFVSLERAARLYAACMRLVDDCRATLPLNLYDLRYEALVEDFEGETRALCGFLGVPWSEDLLRFDRTARRRGVRTASVGQVRRGLYDGSRQWLPYRAYLEPVLPILEPWLP